MCINCNFINLLPRQDLPHLQHLVATVPVDFPYKANLGYFNHLIKKLHIGVGGLDCLQITFLTIYSNFHHITSSALTATTCYIGNHCIIAVWLELIESVVAMLSIYSFYARMLSFNTYKEN